jgi:N6-L-threonylcarbamoyladenine synthase
MEEFAKLCKHNNINFVVPPLKYCTDNAAMIATAAYYAYKKGIIADLSLNATATVSIEKIGDVKNE